LENKALDLIIINNNNTDNYQYCIKILTNNSLCKVFLSTLRVHQSLSEFHRHCVTRILIPYLQMPAICPCRKQYESIPLPPLYFLEIHFMMLPIDDRQFRTILSLQSLLNQNPIIVYIPANTYHMPYSLFHTYIARASNVCQ